MLNDLEKTGSIMKTITSISSLSLLALVVLSNAGCATTGRESATPASSSSPETISYTVKSGDSLGEIAQRLTGDFNNWQAIAARNDITDPRTLAVDQTILIPGSLLDTTYSIDTQTALADDRQATNRNDTSTAVQTDNAVVIPVTTGNGVSVAQGRRTVDTGINTAQITVTPVEINPVEVNRSFDLEPIDVPLPSEPDSAAYDSQSPMVRVNGTYYPKGIYAEPANYARLIRRVAPGTLFQLESEINDWYKIATDDGIAYIRRSDSTLAEPQPDE